MDLCPRTGLGKLGPGENSLGDQVVTISCSLRPRGVGDTFHGLAGLLPRKHQLCLCALGSGRGTLEGINSYQGCRKTVGCLTHTPPRGLGKGQAEQMLSVSVLFPHHTPPHPGSRLPRVPQRRRTEAHRLELKVPRPSKARGPMQENSGDGRQLVWPPTILQDSGIRASLTEHLLRTGSWARG